MPSPAIASSRSRKVLPPPPRRKSWSRTIWFHIAVGATAKKGKQITAAKAALPISTCNAALKRRISSSQTSTIMSVTKPQILIVIVSPTSAPATKIFQRDIEPELISGCSKKMVISSAVVAGHSNSVDLSE